jgi:hypothetical protein
MNYEKDTNCPTTSNLEEGLAFPSLTPESKFLFMQEERPQT